MTNCENCNSDHNGKYGSGRFCTLKCARGFSTKSKRLEINAKVSNKLSTGVGSKGGKPMKEFICKSCSIVYVTNKDNSKFCSKSCKMRSFMTYEVRSDYRKKACKSITERIRLGIIGKKGGFGNKGYTLNNTYYASNLEKQCFEYLESNNIIFEAHKHIPNSSKISDVFLPSKNLWIEIDGINRELRKKWLGCNYDKWIEKLQLYKNNNLNYKIIYNLNEFKQIVC